MRVLERALEGPGVGRSGGRRARGLTLGGGRRDSERVLTHVLPGLRELRAPLAAGYLWLITAWLIFADKLPHRSELNDSPIERLYDLGPLVSDVGTAVAASIAAYVIGSILIDVQVGLSRFTQIFDDLGISLAGYRVLELAVIEARLGLPPLTPDEEASAKDLESMRRRSAMDEATSEMAQEMAVRAKTAAAWIAENREVVKTRLLDASPALHSEVDRPDAEATFRRALWPPLAVIVVYLAITVSYLWLFALALATALAVQGSRLQKQSNDALVTAIVATPRLRDSMLARAFTLPGGVNDSVGASEMQRTELDENAVRDQETDRSR